MMKSNFDLETQEVEQQAKDEYRTKALEAICGSMVFVEGTPLYWDILDDN